MPKDQSPWPELDDQLRAMWGAESCSEIGRRLGLTKNSIVGRAKRLGLPSLGSPIKWGGRTKPEKAKRLAKNAMTLEAIPIDSGEPAEPDSPRLQFRQRASEPCCWPIGEPRTPGFRYCNEPSLPGDSYCPEHRTKAGDGIKRRPPSPYATTSRTTDR